MKDSVRQYAKALAYTSYVRLMDLSAARTAPPSPEARDVIEGLRRDGFVRLGALRDLGGLPDRIAALLDAGEAQHPGVSRFYLKNPLIAAPEIGEWLRLPVINEAVRGYLGGDTVFDRCLVWRIPAAASDRRTSAIWHHDWCGRRLKLFILLHDVDETGRPTQYVRGSNRGKWRWMNYPLSRHSDAAAEAEGEVVQLTGKAGDCILLDTNGLHRATGEGGRKARDVICLEYSDRRKSDFLARRGFEIGIREDLVPASLLDDTTLIDRRQIRESAAGLVYGAVPQLEKEPFV